MAVDVTFHRLAAKEYRIARRRYFRRHPPLASRFVAQIDVAIQKIADYPDRWPVYDGPYRWVKTRRFPYLLIYRVNADGNCCIIAVAHAHRRPGYWKRRLRG